MSGNKKSVFLKIFFLVLVSFLNFVNCQEKTFDVNHLGSSYIEAWIDFYPSSAFAMGHKESAFRFEKFSGESIKKWLKIIKDILFEIKKVNENSAFDERVDNRLLIREIESEIEKWEKNKDHQNNPSFYSGKIAQALTYVLVRENLSAREKIRAVTSRLAGIRKLSLFAIKNLETGRPAQTQSCLRVLRSSVSFYKNRLPEIAAEWVRTDRTVKLKEDCRKTADSIKSLISYMKDNVVPRAGENPDALGKEDYSRKLKQYTGLNITPKELENLANKEIQLVRKKIAKVASEYWKETYPDRTQPEEFKELVSQAIEDMEADHEDNQQNFLKLFVDLTNRAEIFVREKKLAKLPEKRTLFIDLSPAHFAGAAVGGVYSAGPFNPDENTLFYLPTVSDSAPERIKEGFYRSFNNHFNIMIIPHEMFPGHYLHLKITSRNPRRIRSLFGCSLYAEGWATLCEQITLDKGWNGFNKLTRLAHLRKRLENAVRAYVSVQVHFRGWEKEKLLDFAINTGLLAPQFAINLWHRVIGSPFQLTSYFLGYRAFREIYELERKKLGDSFNIYNFSNKILQAGSMPVDELLAFFSFKK